MDPGSHGIIVQRFSLKNLISPYHNHGISSPISATNFRNSLVIGERVWRHSLHINRKLKVASQFRNFLKKVTKYASSHFVMNSSIILLSHLDLAEPPSIYREVLSLPRSHYHRPPLSLVLFLSFNQLYKTSHLRRDISENIQLWI